jgi:hypothetical protein
MCIISSTEKTTKCGMQYHEIYDEMVKAKTPTEVAYWKNELEQHVIRQPQTPGEIATSQQDHAICWMIMQHKNTHPHM